MHFLFYVLLAMASDPAAPWLIGHQGNVYTINAKLLESSYKKNPSQVINAVGFTTSPGPNQTMYIEVTKLKPGNILSPLGIREGDTLITLNGQGLTFALFFQGLKASLPEEWKNKKRFVL